MFSDVTSHGTDTTVIHSFEYLHQMLCTASTLEECGKCFLCFRNLSAHCSVTFFHSFDPQLHI